MKFGKGSLIRQMSKIKNKSLLFKLYGAFFVNGIMALSIGAILPYVIEEKGINYSMAGSLLSAFAIGNFLASFIFPILCNIFGRKWSVVLTTAVIPICFLILAFLPSAPILYMIMLVIGIGRGCCSVFSNSMVNDSFSNLPGTITILHTVFAVGAFIAPFIMSLSEWMNFGWKFIIYLLFVLWIIVDIFYITIQDETASDTDESKNGKTDYSFFKNINFYIIGLLLFFYLGVENCVNGWFITYFKESGIMTDTYANNLVSIVWIMVMAGRLVNVKLSSKWEKRKLILINCSGAAIFFILLIITNRLNIITAAIVGLGFFLAGIYPICISSLGNILKGSTSGMSYLLAMAALGGIITPKIVGMIADQSGMNFAIMILIVNVFIMCILAIINNVRNSNKEIL